MRKIFRGLLLASAVSICTTASSFAASPAEGFWQYPVIKDYGREHPLPHAAMQPDPEQVYKVVFDITKSEQHSSGVNYSLYQLARAVNVYAQAGVTQEHRQFAAIIRGAAAPTVLSNEAYKERFGKDNPNLGLIHELKKAGVAIYVCGQAVAEAGMSEDDIDADVTLTVSALLTIPILQSKGFTFFPM